MSANVQYSRKWVLHIDRLGLIGNWDSNPARMIGKGNYQWYSASPGDEAQRFGMYWWGRVLEKIYGGRKEIEPAEADIADVSVGLGHLECESSKHKGNYRRYAIVPQQHWSGACDRFTRDQSTGVCAAFLASKFLDQQFSNRKKRLAKFLWNMMKRLGFTNNYTKRGLPVGHELEGKSWRDWFGFSQWAMGMRGLGGPLFYWAYLILDIELVINAVTTRWFYDGDDVLNFVLRTTTARTVCPTPWSWLACKISDPGHLAKCIGIYFTRTFKPFAQIGPPMETIYTEQLLRKVMHG